MRITLKNLTIGLVLIVLTAYCTSCQKATYLKVDTDTIKATIEGTSGDIKIDTDGRSVIIEHAPRWINASVNEDHTALHYEVGLNVDRKLREDSIVLKSSDLTCMVYVRQTFKATYIKFDQDTVRIPRKGGSVEVNVEVDADSPLHINNENIAKVDGRTINITLPETYNPKGITEIVRVSCDDISADLCVVQEVKICNSCGGSGFGKKPCSYCGGIGLHACCNFTGKEQCPVCGGFGYVD